MMIVVLASTAIIVLVAGELCKGGKYIVADLLIKLIARVCSIACSFGVCSHGGEWSFWKVWCS